MERKPFVNPYLKKTENRSSSDALKGSTPLPGEITKQLQQSQQKPNRNIPKVHEARTNHDLYVSGIIGVSVEKKSLDGEDSRSMSMRSHAAVPGTSMIKNPYKDNRVTSNIGNSVRFILDRRNRYQKEAVPQKPDEIHVGMMNIQSNLQRSPSTNREQGNLSRQTLHPATVSSPINSLNTQTESSSIKVRPLVASSPINPYTGKPMIIHRSSPNKTHPYRNNTITKLSADGNDRPPPAPEHTAQRGCLKGVTMTTKNIPIQSLPPNDLQCLSEQQNSGKAASSPCNPYMTKVKVNAVLDNISLVPRVENSDRENSTTKAERHSDFHLDPTTTSNDSGSIVSRQQRVANPRELHDVAGNPCKRPCLEPNHVDIKMKCVGASANSATDIHAKPHVEGATTIQSNTNSAPTVKKYGASINTSCTGPKLPALPPDLEYDESRLKHIDDEFRLKLIKAAELGGELKNGWKLLPHQKVGVLKAIQMRRYILAYDMGLGKTLIGCVWAKAFKKTFPDLKVHIISPVSLKKEWHRTATDIVGLKCENEKEQKSAIQQGNLDIRISSWAKVPLRVPPDVQKYIVICDEAHNLQSMESARTQDTLKLVQNKRCIGVLLLTGTPMKNGKPSNLFPLLKAVRHPFGDNQKLFEIFFCHGQLKRFRNKEVWDASGSSNLGVLNAHITSHILYKTKEECLKELPGKKREYKKVPVGSKFGIQHARALNDLASIYEASTSNPGGDTSIGNEAILGAFSRLRQIAAFAKVDATVSLAKSILEEEPSLVIFTYFVSVAKEVHRKLQNVGWAGELLAGETPSSKRQAMVDNFQDGISPVFIATFGAGGVGITLTAARTIILMDRPWTPGDALQAEDRVRRIGQTKTVRSVWIRAFDIDTQIDNLIEHKSQNANSVVDSKHSSLSNVSKAAPKISIRQLVKTIISKNDNASAAKKC